MAHSACCLLARAQRATIHVMPDAKLLLYILAPRSAGLCMPTGRSPTMPVVHVMVHPRGLHPVEAARAYHLHAEEGLSLDSVCDEVRNMEGNMPS